MWKGCQRGLCPSVSKTTTVFVPCQLRGVLEKVCRPGAWDVLLAWDLLVSWGCLNGTETSLHQRTSQRSQACALWESCCVCWFFLCECSQSRGSVWGQCWHLHAGCSSVAPCAEPSAFWSVEDSSCSVWACLYTNPAFSAGSCCLCSAAAVDTVRAGGRICSCTLAER